MRVVAETILALDLATCTGIAYGRPGEDPVFATHTLPTTGNDVGAYVVAFEDLLSELIGRVEPTLVVFEAPVLPRRTQLATVRKLNGLCSETERLCKRFGLRVQEVNVSRLKLFFAGHGKAAKDDMERTARRYGWCVRSEHEADACAVWAWAVYCHAAPEHKARFAGGPLGARPLRHRAVTP